MDRVFQRTYWRTLFSASQGLIAVLNCLVLIPAALAQQFPYVAYVAGEQAYVRSGPGQRHYPTGQIAPGYAVEVYRHDDDGWCAIRPLESSFSWVPNHQVRRTSADVVEVIDDHVVARVGSNLSPNRSVVQVLLPKGELLQLVATDHQDDPRWVRIAAPSGEFRWIAAKDLSRQPPMEIVPPASVVTQSGWTQQTTPTQKKAATKPTAFDHLNQTANNSQAGLQFGSPAKPLSAAPTQMQQTDPIAIDPNAMDVVAGSPAELQLAQLQTAPNAAKPPALLEEVSSAPKAALPAQPRVRFHGLTPPGTTAAVGSVAELELQLSQAVVQSPLEWNLTPLEAAANKLLTETKTPPVRAQLREVLQRITRFKQIQDAYKNPTPPPVVAQRDPFESAAVEAETPSFTGQSADVRERIRKDLAGNTGTPNGPTGQAPQQTVYDATGVLKPVVSKRPEAPQFALVDERGKVLSFITPTPDLNLQSYVGRRIGVNGTRGFMPEYRRPHVTAGRVTPIEGTLRR